MDEAERLWAENAWRLAPPDSPHPWRTSLKPSDMTDRAWLGFLLDKQIGAVWVSDIPRLAVCFTLAEICDPLNARSSGVANIAQELGWQPRTLNELRLGKVYPWYIQIYELGNHPKYGKLLWSNESHLFAEYVAWRRDLRTVPFHRHHEVRIINSAGMYPNGDLPRLHLDMRTRKHLEESTVYGIAQLATNTPVPNVPKRRNEVDWRRVAQSVFHGAFVKPASHRDMVRTVIPAMGETVSLAKIRERIRQQYGDAAPSDRAITMAVLHLYRAGALRRESKGAYVATDCCGNPQSRAARNLKVRRRRNNALAHPRGVPRKDESPRYRLQSVRESSSRNFNYF